MKQATARSFSFIEPMKALSVQKCRRATGFTKSSTMGTGPWLSKRAKMCAWSHAIKRSSITLTCYDALKLLAAQHVILDGEIVALDEKGRSSFQLLNYSKVPEVSRYVFDLLFLEERPPQATLSARR